MIDVQEHLYRTVQIAVRQYLGKRTLEEMLAEKTDLDAAVAETVRREMEGLGVRVGVIAIKDVVLPGDVRDILNQVVTAEKQAQANLIRRREEVASTRSLLNTAKLMGENPLLVRLKELESLEKIADKVDKITVVGGMNGWDDGDSDFVNYVAHLDHGRCGRLHLFGKRPPRRCGSGAVSSLLEQPPARDGVRRSLHGGFRGGAD